MQVLSFLWNNTNKIFTLLSPDFFQLFYTGFILFSLYSATWMLSVKMKDLSLVNFIWGISFSIQAIIYFYKSLEYSIFSFFSQKFSWEKLTFYTLIFAHGIRLSAYLILRELGKGEDRRWTKLREKFGNHFWWLSYFLVFLPAMQFNMMLGFLIYAFANVDKSSISHVSYWAGIFTMLLGGLIGSLADIQKYTFLTAKRNEGKILDKGLWGFSRHPNYLGEIIFWWGAFLVNFSASILWTIICPSLLTFMILFVTGIPVNERVMKEEHGQNFLDYAKRVPILIPFFGARGGKSKEEESQSGESKGNVAKSPQENVKETRAR
jgi:steroid 5-alpha reductase family enzyme